MEGVRLEAERLNGGPRLVPACNCGLTRGNYWIPHRISQPLSSLLFFFIRIVLALLCLPGSFCSCTINLPSTFLSFGSFGFSVAVSPPRSPTVLSPHVMGPRLSPLLSAFTSPGSLRSLCSDGQGLNAALEMIRPLCSCSGGFFFVVVVFLSSPLTPSSSFFLSLCLYLAILTLYLVVVF